MNVAAISGRLSEKLYLQFYISRRFSNTLRTTDHVYKHYHSAQCCTRQTQPSFHQLHKYLHTSPHIFSSKLKNTRKKTLKPISFKPKGTKFMVIISHDMTVQQLADAMKKSVDHVFDTMFYIPGAEFYDESDSAITNLQVIKDVIKKSGMLFKYEERIKKVKENKDEVKRPPAPSEQLSPRPPVVTIMGHVDHGKTTLLDTMRNSSIVDTEFGGITQHIGAFSVLMPGGERITFLDTPGHAAFHAMRARGTDVTDIVVLVVAADDGVMRQTQESIKHAQDAGVPIIVAINKIDKPVIDIPHVKTGLMQQGVVLEDMGGDIQAVPISALKGTNLALLQEAILAQAELLELKADYGGLVEGAVLESSTDIGRGKLATVLVSRGTLRKGCIVVAGTAWAKVRGMFNEHGKPVLTAGPGDAVEVIGWRDLPHAGQEILEIETERRAHEVLNWRKEVAKEEQASKSAIVVRLKQDEHDQVYQEARKKLLAKGIRRNSIARRSRDKEQTNVSEGPQLSIVLKGDVDGSVEAILEVLDTYDSSQCQLHIMSYGVGSVTENDIDMVSTFGGVIYAFNVSATKTLQQIARSKGIDIREHNIIYKMIDDIREELTQRLLPTEEESQLGVANVQQTFMVSDKNKKFPVAGCRCHKGQLAIKKRFKVIRNEEILLDDELTSLKHFKNEVDTVKTGVECGLMFKDTSFQPQIGDTVICYEMKEVQAELDWYLEF